MKVISLYQPFASLVVCGAKQFETRSWDTQYRGPLLIHATKSMPRWCIEIIAHSDSQQFLNAGLYESKIPQGFIIGQVELVRTLRSEDWKEEKTIEGQELWSFEYEHGDYSPNRFAWELKNPVRFVNPIPAKGSQGFWNFDINIFPMPTP